VRATCEPRIAALHADPSCTPQLDLALVAPQRQPWGFPPSLAVLALLVKLQSHGCEESALHRYAEAEVAMYRMSELKLVEGQQQR
jgi:hypothetical protein